MRLFRNLLGIRAKKDPLSKIEIDDDWIVHEGIEDGERHWRTLEGDCVDLHYFPIPPDLPAGQSSIEEFRTAYRSAVDAEVLEIDVCSAAGVSVIRTIVKIPQEPRGNTYVGAYTIPFRDLSYVLKITCQEVGTTGIREAVRLAKSLSSGDISIDDDGQIQGNWSHEDEAYDSDFPFHPLSRCRKCLGIFASSLKVAEELRNLPAFELPSGS